MITKFNTGDAVLIPAIIRSAEEIDGRIVYHVDAEIWEGIPEDAVMTDGAAELQIAMKQFVRQMDEKWGAMNG